MSQLVGGLTSHSTGADSAWLLSVTWMLFDDAFRPVNSSVMPLTMIEDMTNVERTSELVFEIQDAWELGICTCCSNSYLLRLTSGQYLYLDSWRLTPFAESESFPKRNLRLVVDPNKKVVLSVHISGPMVSKRPEMLDRVAESELAGSEYSLLSGDDLPVQWRRLLIAA